MVISPSDLSVVDLEAQTTALAYESGIAVPIWENFLGLLEVLKTHSPRMYAHSLRVGGYAAALALAEEPHEVRLALYGGCGHDMGKALIPNHILDAVELSEDEWKIMRGHPRDGFELLRDHFLLTALVAGLHHRHQVNGYGIVLEEEVPERLSEEAIARVLKVSHIVAIADHFDALTTRQDARNRATIANQKNPQEIFNAMQATFPSSEQHILSLLACQGLSL